MTSILSRLFGSRRSGAGDRAFDKAMNVSSDLIHRMHEYSASTDVARAIMADIWQQNHNVPFTTTIFQAVQEIKSGIKQRRDDRR